MGSQKSRRHRRRWRRHVRTVLLLLLALGALPGVVAAGISGNAQLLWLIPAGMVTAVVATPVALLALLTMALPLLVVGLTFGVPMVLAYRMLDRGRPGAPGLTPEATLRRRYVAGELSYTEFRDTMLERLKERYAGGELRLAEYELEVERLLRPGRQLDAGRDPSLSDAYLLR
jgi:hypothetical protein